MSITLLITHISLWLTIIFDVPVARQVIGFIYLTFVPGFVILRLFNAKFVFTEKLLFSVGLSIGFVMGIGLLVNSFGPFLGVFKPLSTETMILAISIPTVVCIFAGWNKGDFDNLSFSARKFLAIGAVLSALPILSIIGTLSARSNGGNTGILLGALFVFSFIAASVVFLAKHLSSEIYCIIALSIAIALLLQLPFVSSRLIGFDIWNENYVVQSV